MLRRSGFAILFFAVASASTSSSLPEMRMTPLEVPGVAVSGNSQIGSSMRGGVHTKVLFGDPAKAGFYSILLFVPEHTTIQAHSHRDDRTATVDSGEWQLGYGGHFEEKWLKTLPAGSVYSEPAGRDHFARSGNTPAIVHICGYGPTDTRYFEPANEPR